MHKTIKYLFFLIPLLYLSSFKAIGQIEPLAIDTISASGSSLLNEINAETKSMSNYFSVSKIVFSFLIIISTYIFLRILACLLYTSDAADE